MEKQSFICNGCNCHLEADYCFRTPGFCYLCDPAISLAELLDSPSDNVPILLRGSLLIGGFLDALEEVGLTMVVHRLMTGATRAVLCDGTLIISEAMAQLLHERDEAFMNSLEIEVIWSNRPAETGKGAIDFF